MPLALWVKGRAFQSPGVEEDLEDNCQDLLVSWISKTANTKCDQPTWI